MVKSKFKSSLEYNFQLHKINTNIRERDDKKKIEYSWEYIRSKSVDRVLKAYVEKEGHRFFYKLFGIYIKTIYFDVSFDGVPLEKDTYNPHNYELLMNEDLNILSSIETSEIHIDIDGENLSDVCHFTYEIISQNEFKGTILIKYSFDYVEEVNPWVIIDGSVSYLKCTAYAIEKDELLFLWQEYLMSSFIFHQLGNQRMAFFNAFAALDQCIEIMYQSLFNAFSSMEKYAICSDVTADARKYIIDEYKRNEKKERRLIEEKLKDCLKTISSDIGYSQLLENLKRFDKIRNKIAHCENSDELVNSESYIDLIWSILELIVYTNGKAVKDLIVFNLEDHLI